MEDRFPVFSAIKSKGRPDLVQYGLIPLRVVYTAEIWSRGDSLDEPNPAKIRQVARSLTANTPVCIDIEHWPVTGNNVTVATSIRKLKEVISTIATWLVKEQKDVLLRLD